MRMIFQMLNCTVLAESSDLTLQIVVAIQIRITAPASESPLKKDSGSPRAEKSSRLMSATRVSVTIAINMILRLFEKPDWSISVNTAVITGPGITPPIRPSKTAMTSSWIMVFCGLRVL